MKFDPTAQEMLTVLAMTTDERRSLLHFHERFPDDLIKLAAKIEADHLKKEKDKAKKNKQINESIESARDIRYKINRLDALSEDYSNRRQNNHLGMLGMADMWRQ